MISHSSGLQGWSDEDLSLSFPLAGLGDGAGAPEGLGGGTGPFQVGGRPLVSALDNSVLAPPPVPESSVPGTPVSPERWVWLQRTLSQSGGSR